MKIEDIDFEYDTIAFNYAWPWPCGDRFKRHTSEC